jgi:hypothetical protein
MLDFQPVREKKISLQDLVKDLTRMICGAN